MLAGFHRKARIAHSSPPCRAYTPSTGDISTDSHIRGWFRALNGHTALPYSLTLTLCVSVQIESQQVRMYLRQPLVHGLKVERMKAETNQFTPCCELRSVLRAYKELTSCCVLRLSIPSGLSSLVTMSHGYGSRGASVSCPNYQTFYPYIMFFLSWKF